MDFSLVPATDDKEYWTLTDTNTGEVIESCATPEEITHILFKFMNCANEEID